MQVWGEEGHLTKSMVKGLAEADTGITDPPHNWEADSTFCIEAIRSQRELSREDLWRLGMGMTSAFQRCIFRRALAFDHFRQMVVNLADLTIGAAIRIKTTPLPPPFPPSTDCAPPQSYAPGQRKCSEKN